MSEVQTEVISKLSELSAQIRELVIELRHTQSKHETQDLRMDKQDARMERVEESIRQIQLEAALNKPILDIARAINTKMWLTILGSAVAVSASAMDWSKLVGG